MNPLKQFYQAPSLLILCLSLAATSVSTPSLAVPFSQKEFCKNLTRDKSRQAFLFNAAGTELLPHFDIGHLDATKDKVDSDYLMSLQQFRLVLFPKRLEFDNFDTQSIGLIKKKVPAQCPLTSEYILNVGVVARNFMPGKLNVEVNIKITDPKLRFPEYTNVKLAYRNIITGEISKPLIDLDEPIILKNALKSLFDTEKNSAKVTLKNIGNRPLRFGTWDIDNEQEREIAIKENTCRNIQLEPNDYCDITISKTTAKPLSKTFYSWVVRARAGEFETILHIDIQKYGGGEVGAEVRNR